MASKQTALGKRLAVLTAALPLSLALSFGFLSLAAEAVPGLSLPNLENPMKQAAEAFEAGNYEAAVVILNRILASDRHNLEALIKRGVAFVKLNQRERALKDFNRAFEEAPDNPRVALVRGACFYELKRYREALHDLEAACRAYPTDYFPFLLAASTAYHLDDYNKALKYGKETLGLGYKPDLNFRLMLAECHVALGQYKIGEELLDKLIEAPDVTAEVWVAKGNLEAILKHPKEALQCYEKALQLSPGNSQAIYQKALLKLSTDKSESGLKELKEAVEKNPDNHKLRLFRAELFLKLKRYEEALADYKILEKAIPLDARVYRGQAAIMALTERNDEVLALAQKANKLDPDDPAASLILATALATNGKSDEAEKAFNSAVKNAGNDTMPRLLRARFFVAQKRYKEALEDYDLLLKSGQEDTELLTARLVPLFELGDYDRALKDVNKLLLSGHKDDWLYLASGTAKASLGQYKTAVSDLERYALNAPAKAPIYTLIARAYLGAHEYNKAIAAAGQALALTPNYHEARKIRVAAYFAAQNWQGIIDDTNYLSEQEKIIKQDQKSQEKSNTNSTKNSLLDENLLEWRGFAFYVTGMPLKALECFNSIIEQFPESSLGYADAALIYIETGMLPEAEKLINTALTKENKGAKLYFEKAELDLLLKRDQEALKALDQAIQIKPDYASALKLRAGIAFKNSNLELAKESLEKLLALRETANFKEELQLADILSRLGEEDAAKARRMKAMTMHLSSSEDYMERARFSKEHGLSQKGFFEFAKDDYLKAFAADHKNISAIYALCALYEKKGENQKLLELLRNLRQKKEYADAQAILAFCTSNTRLAMGNYDKAINELKAIKNPGDFKLLICKQEAAIALARGHFAIAMQAVNDMEKSLGPSSTADILKAQILSKQAKKDEAISHLDKAIERDGDLDAYELKALYLNDLKAPEQALKVVEEAIEQMLKTDKRSRTDIYSKLLYLKAINLEDLRQEREALKTLDSAIRFDATNNSALLERARLLYESGQFGEATHDLLASIKRGGENSDCLYLLGNCYRRLGHFDKAVTSYDRALTIRPVFYDALFQRANCKYMLKDFQGALKDYNAALKISSKSQECYINRGGTYGAMGDFAGLLRDLHTAKHLGTTTRLMLTNEGIALKGLKRYQEAAERFREAIKADSKRIESYIDLANCYAAQSEKAELAIATLDEAARIDPENFNLLKAKSKILRQRGDFNGAFQAASAYVGYCPKDLAMQAVYLRLANLAGRREELKTKCDQLLKDNPDWVDGWFELGHYFLSENKPEDALKAFQKVDKMVKNDHECWLNIAVSLSRLGRYDEALDYARKAEESENFKKESRLMEAAILLSSGKQEKSKEVLTKLIEQNRSEESGLSLAASALMNHINGKEEKARSQISRAANLSRESYPLMQIKQTIEVAR